MWTRTSIYTSCIFVLAAACGGSQPPSSAPPPPPPPGPAPTPAAQATPPPPAETAKPEPAKEEKPAAPAAPAPIVRYAEGLSTPESVLYDEPNDRYLVSNINGKPTDTDNNGYISELSPDGKVTKDKFIAGGVNKVKLDAPKGLGISQGVLYVSDITVVRKFDAKTGAHKGDIAFKGATFLNDIAVGSDGKVYVSDSGLKAGGDGFEPTGTDAVYVIDKAGKVKTIAKSKELAGPNGLLATDKGLLVAPFGSNEVYRLDEKGKREDITKLPEGGLDGIVWAGDTLLVSSWKGSAIYRGKLNDKFEVAFSGLKAPADIGFDTKRKRVLVPRFMDNAVEVYEVK
jgi:sugar lactone lactonase YvrE